MRQSVSTVLVPPRRSKAIDWIVVHVKPFDNRFRGFPVGCSIRVSEETAVDREIGVLITGGSRGLGRAVAERIAGQGGLVGILARTASDVEATANRIREMGGRALGLTCDVLDAPRLKAVFGKFRAWAGRFDALVCAAGQLKGVGPLAAVDSNVWWSDLETSVRGVQHALRESIPHLRQSTRPAIAILVGPGHNQALPFATGYSSAQAALVRLAESVSHELSPEGIPVFAVNPGLVHTDLTRRWLESAQGRRWLPQWTEAFAEGKEVGPDVVAEMIDWLIERRPFELTGRVVAAPLSPEILEMRLSRIHSENRGILRVR